MADRRDRLTGVAWALVAISGLLLFASARGHGTGSFGSGLLRHAVWMYATFLALVFAGLWIVGSARPAAPVRPDAPSAERDAR